MPNKIFEGLGPGTLVPQRGRLPIDDPKVGADEGFVLSRVDGRTSLEEILMLVPFEEPVTMVILRRLWEMGAIEVPGVARIMKRPTGPMHIVEVPQPHVTRRQGRQARLLQALQGVSPGPLLRPRPR